MHNKRQPIDRKSAEAIAIQGLAFLDASGHAGHQGGDHIVHLVFIAGMVLVLAAVVVDGARRQLGRRRTNSPQGGDS